MRIQVLLSGLHATRTVIAVLKPAATIHRVMGDCLEQKQTVSPLVSSR